MFKATVVASKLRERMAHYFEMVTGNNVLQVFHRGGEVKVIMTQEHYFELTSRLALYETHEDTKPVRSINKNQLAEEIRRESIELEAEAPLEDNNAPESNHRLATSYIRATQTKG